MVQDAEGSERMSTLLSILEDHDDVVAVYHNAV